MKEDNSRNIIVDMLRGVAVISVLLYHFKILSNDDIYLKGGFLGVDLFFIISGFVITKSYFNPDYSDKPLKSFLIRRAKRIIPLLSFIILLTQVAGWFVLFPGNFSSLAKASLSSLSFVSNYFYYYDIGSYGAKESEIFPLLHTWSLSVEVQLYILFAISAYVLCKIKNKKNIILGVVLLFFLSMFWWGYFEKDNPNFRFFDTLSRAWEFMIGCSICLLYKKNKNIPKFVKLIILFSFFIMALIFYYASYDVVHIKHPIIIFIFSCFATVILIYQDCFIIRRLSYIYRFFGFFGKRSYSYYLCHFPIYTYISTYNLNLFYSIFTSFILTSIIAEFCYRKIESVKYKKIKIKFVLPIFSLSFFVVPLAIIFNNGFPYRYSFSENYIVGIKYYLNEWLKFKDHHAGLEYVGYGKKKVLIIGNSHGRDVYNMFILNLGEFNNYKFSFTSQPIGEFYYNFQVQCIPSIIDNKITWCSKDKYDWKKLKNLYEQADIIIIASRYNGNEGEFLPPIIDKMKKQNKKVIIFGNTIQYPPLGGDLDITPNKIMLNPLDNFVLKNGGVPIGKKLYDLERGFYLRRKYTRGLNDMIKNVANLENVQYIDRAKYMCNLTKKICDVLTDKGEKILYDYGHLTIGGAKYLGAKKEFYSLLNDAMSRSFVPQKKYIKIITSSTLSDLGAYGLLWGASPGWHAQHPVSFPQFIQFDFVKPKSFNKIQFLYQDGFKIRMPKSVDFYVSNDGKKWNHLISNNDVCDIKENMDGWIDLSVNKVEKYQHIKVIINSNCDGGSYLTLRGLRFR